MEKVSDILSSYTPSENEAQTEADLVRSILDVLGHPYEVQPAIATPGGTKRPDYMFYRDTETLSANKDRTLNEELLHLALHG